MADARPETLPVIPSVRSWRPADGICAKSDFRAFVKRTAAKGVDIVPEIDAPAHSCAFIRYRPAFQSKVYGDTHLDLHNPDVVPFFEKLFAEYCGGDDPVFAGPNVSVGTDEYDKREAEAFRAFTDAMFKTVRRLGKRPRAWGVLTHAAGKTPVDPTDVTLDIWHNDDYRVAAAAARSVAGSAARAAGTSGFISASGFAWNASRTRSKNLSCSAAVPLRRVRSPDAIRASSQSANAANAGS